MAGTRRVVAWLSDDSRELLRRWHGEYDSTTLRSVPSWGVSFLLHALLALDSGLDRSGSGRRRDPKRCLTARSSIPISAS